MITAVEDATYTRLLQILLSVVVARSNARNAGVDYVKQQCDDTWSHQELDDGAAKLAPRALCVQFCDGTKQRIRRSWVPPCHRRIPGRCSMTSALRTQQ